MELENYLRPCWFCALLEWSCAGNNHRKHKCTHVHTSPHCTNGLWAFLISPMSVLWLNRLCITTFARFPSYAFSFFFSCCVAFPPSSLLSVLSPLSSPFPLNPPHTTILSTQTWREGVDQLGNDVVAPQENGFVVWDLLPAISHNRKEMKPQIRAATVSLITLKWFVSHIHMVLLNSLPAGLRAKFRNGLSVAWALSVMMMGL